jgi:hypothetical protein
LVASTFFSHRTHTNPKEEELLEEIKETSQKKKKRKNVAMCVCVCLLQG